MSRSQNFQQGGTEISYTVGSIVVVLMLQKLCYSVLPRMPVLAIWRLLVRQRPVSLVDVWARSPAGGLEANPGQSTSYHR